MAAPAESFPAHPDPWTLDELLAQPEQSGQRIELVDGVVVMSPAPTPNHQRMLYRLLMALGRVLPPELELLPGVNVVLNGDRLLIPDLVITTVPGHTELCFTAEQILLAAEIMSPSSKAYDRALKSQLYAEAGLPFYLIVDDSGETPVAVLYGLGGDGYDEVARSRDGLLTMRSPIEAVLDLGPRR